MAMIVCPQCGEQVSEKAKKCVHCGAILIPEEKKHCIECGVELEEGMTECPNCGCPVDDTIGHKEDKPQKVEVTGVKVTKKIKVIIGVVVRRSNSIWSKPISEEKSSRGICTKGGGVFR